MLNPHHSAGRDPRVEWWPQIHSLRCVEVLGHNMAGTNGAARGRMLGSTSAQSLAKGSPMARTQNSLQLATSGVPRVVSRFGVVVPVHNEECLISAALDSIDLAIQHLHNSRATLGIAVVLDKCSDRSIELVADWRRRNTQFRCPDRVEVVELEAGNVGSARRVGCEALLTLWSDVPPEEIWLATTDADSEVPPDWVSAQIRMRNEGAQVWIGAVDVRDWSGRALGTAEAWRNQYETEQLPVHGANLGIDAATYLAADGFADLETGEDRELVDKAVRLGAVIRHDPYVQVVTSSRREARAPRGFAHALTAIEGRFASSLADWAELATL